MNDLIKLAQLNRKESQAIIEHLGKRIKEELKTREKDFIGNIPAIVEIGYAKSGKAEEDFRQNYSYLNSHHDEDGDPVKPDANCTCVACINYKEYLEEKATRKVATYNPISLWSLVRVENGYSQNEEQEALKLIISYAEGKLL